MDDARELARWARLVTANRLINLDPMTWTNTGQGGNTHGGAEFCTPAAQLAEAFDAMADLKWPRSVARFCIQQGCSVRQRGVDAGIDIHKMEGAPSTGTFGAILPMRPIIAERLDMLSIPDTRSGAVPLFVELCAGLASVSLVLQGGPKARPPVSRMGNKRGYAEAILWACGLRQGQGARAFLWCEPDPGCRALLTAYGQPEVLRQAAAIIRGWADEEPRELWERLKAEGPIKGAEAGEVARWATVQRWTYANAPLDSDLRIAARAGSPSTFGTNNFGDTSTTARNMATAITFPAITVSPDARDIDPPELPAGSVCYIDPPYVNTTGYGHDLPRAAVVAMARRWRDAGALVAVSEQEALPELMAEGWHAVDITSTRRGQKRTFSRQQREWLTMSEPPRWTPAEQLGLFG